MQNPNSQNDVTLNTFLRLQRWRHRQQQLWPGLFSDFLTVLDTSENPKTHTITLQSFRNVEHRLLIDQVPILLCDGCGALQQFVSPASSDSTLPPSKEEASSLFLTCSSCSFPTPLGHFRTILALPNCGPHLPQPLALAILVEATNSQVSLANTHPTLHGWIRDNKCRMEGLHVLLGAIGAREEQLCPPKLSASDNNETSSVLEEQRSNYYCAQQAERYLERDLSSEIDPKLSFSVTDLYQAPIEGEEGIQAGERAKTILMEAGRIWKECAASIPDKHFIFKLNNLAKEFLVEQTNARIYNHARFVLSPGKPDT